MNYGHDCGLEAIFLLGQFGVELVDNCPKMSFPPKELEVGDWTRQGLPFYSGSVIYRQTVKVVPKKGQRVFVEIPEYAGVCFRVLVNGKSIESKGWAPYEVDITDAIDCEKVDLAIEVFAHRRNSFGPLHLKGRVSTQAGLVLTSLLLVANTGKMNIVLLLVGFSKLRF